MIETTYNYEKLGEYINRIRLRLGISIKQLCDDCHISRRTYYESSEWQRFEVQFLCPHIKCFA